MKNAASAEAARRLEFRPPRFLRVALMFIGLAALLPALLLAVRSVSGDRPASAVVSLVLLTPGLIALFVFPRIYCLTDSEVTLTLPWAHTAIPYTRISWVDETRGGLRVESAKSSLTFSWLTPHQRERVLEGLIERAGLIRGLDPPFGVLARYVPRTSNIAFAPHHARRSVPPDS